MSMNAIDFFKNLQLDMDRQSDKVRSMVEYSRTSGSRLRLGEVTVTELNFYELRNSFTKNVHLYTNEPDETTTGADWEWLIGYDKKWISLRVQAKILGRGERRCSFTELGHPRNTGAQIRTLVNPPAAYVTCRWMPLYVFYTSSPPLPPSGTATTHGCSVQSAVTVEKIFNPTRHNKARHDLKASTYLNGAQPWRNVFDGLIQRLDAGESMHSIVDSLANESLPATTTSLADFWNPTITAGSCSKNLPSYIHEITRKDNDEFTASKDVILRIKTGESNSGEKAEEVSPIDRLGPTDRLEKNQLLEIETISTFPSLPVREIRIDAPPGSNEFEGAGDSLPAICSVIDLNELSFD